MYLPSISCFPNPLIGFLCVGYSHRFHTKSLDARLVRHGGRVVGTETEVTLDQVGKMNVPSKYSGTVKGYFIDEHECI